MSDALLVASGGGSQGERAATAPGERPWSWRLLELAVLQAVWLLVVGAAGRGNGWIGPLAVGLLLPVYAARSATPSRELFFFAVLGLGGSLIDSLQGGFGILEFRLRPAEWVCPLWITAMWVHLGMQLRGPLASLVGRPWLAATLGAVGGPLAYWAGVRLGAAQFHPRPVLSVVVIGAVWAIALPLVTRLAGATARRERVVAAGGEGDETKEDSP